jgi:hypothetical protein
MDTSMYRLAGGMQRCDNGRKRKTLYGSSPRCVLIIYINCCTIAVGMLGVWKKDKYLLF